MLVGDRRERFPQVLILHGLLAGRAPTAPAPTVEPVEPTGYVATSLLNLRAGPGTGYTILAHIPQGVALSLTGRNPAAGAWWQVSYQGQPGWVAGDYLRTAGPVDQVPNAPIPALAGATPGRAPANTENYSLVYELLLGDMSDLIDEERRSQLLQKWQPAVVSSGEAP